jgi:predicted AAA+ superfamily ATPase
LDPSGGQLVVDYIRRVIDEELDALLPTAGAIAIEGPRFVGKTETAARRANTIYRLDEPARHAIIAADPDTVLRGDQPILVDEWQLEPATWDAVRREVDRNRRGSQFLLTGSASPSNPPTHSGGGRILSLRMRPMTLAERGVATPTVSIAELLEGDRPRLGGETRVSIDEYAHEITRSGFPDLRDSPERTVRAQLGGYLARIVDRDFRDLGGLDIRNKEGLRRWMQAYAAAVGSTTSYDKIRDAATGGYGAKPSRPTVATWFDVLERLWLIEPVPAWLPSRSDLSRLSRGPKHAFVEPALAARLRGASATTLLAGAPAGALANRNEATMFGALFESQVIQDVRVFAQAAEATVSHFRTEKGEHEIDVIVERADRKVLAIEAKVGGTITDEAVRHLVWLRERIGEDFLDGIVISTGPAAYRRRDGIGVVPLALLGR